MQPQLPQYKKIHLQDLPRKVQPSNFHGCDQENFIQKLDRTADISDYYHGKMKGQGEVYFYRDTGAEQRHISRESNFFKAFYCAYQNHGDLILIPDDVWMSISIFLAQYIDKHAEKLRSLFVKHEGQKQLVVVEYAGSVEESLAKEKEWDNFFEQTIKGIEQNTVEGVVDALKCNFSTTDKTYELISASIIMSSFKQYFAYTK